MDVAQSTEVFYLICLASKVLLGCCCNYHSDHGYSRTNRTLILQENGLQDSRAARIDICVICALHKQLKYICSSTYVHL